MADLDNKPGATQGTMDVSHQKKTFGGFVRTVMWVIILSLAVLLFLALANV